MKSHHDGEHEAAQKDRSTSSANQHESRPTTVSSEKRKRDDDHEDSDTKKESKKSKSVPSDDSASFWSASMLKDLQNELKSMSRGGDQEWGKAAEKVRLQSTFLLNALP